MTTPFRSLPSVERVLSHESVKKLVKRFSRQAVVNLVRARLENERQAISTGVEAPDFDELVATIEELAQSRWRSWPKPLINATGVVLHTNLGRAPLSPEAMEAVRLAGAGYGDLELDLETGKRGSRQSHVGGLLCELTGAEAALVVNNNASAVLLGLTALCTGREVIVSRGESVEIGGGFRIPDVLRQSGAELVEVGTTNRTYARDYEAAISDRTAAVLSVHPSNFSLVGFTHSPNVAELVELGQRHGVPVLHDLGSGCLLDTRRFGLGHEPMPQESVQSGVGLAFFSGDKLLGGPQAGIIVGRLDLVNSLAEHPLARVVRMDKLSMAALSATLLHYLRQEAVEKIPVWGMIAASEKDLKTTSHSWAETLGPRTSVTRASSTIGGGSLPGETLPTWALSIDASGLEGGAEALAGRLRQAELPVLGRIDSESLLLDPRTVLPKEREILTETAKKTLAEVDRT